MLRAETVRVELSERIAADHLAVGTRLPSEPKLAAELGVSRATVRDALRALEQEGLVRRVQGSGTYVAHPRVPNSLDMNFGVTAAIRQGGMRPGVEHARHWVEPAAASEAERLELAPGEDVLVIDRVRTADGRPVVLSRDVLPRKLLGEGDDAVEAMLAGSVYEVLEDKFGITIQYGIASLQPVRAESSLTERLRVDQGELLFYLWQVDYAESGAPILSSHEYHVASAFEFSVVRRGPGKRLT
jgi:GntR family transcriptional regulator